MPRWLSNLLILFFCAVFLVSGYFLLDYYLESRQQQDQFDQLAAMVSQAQPTLPEPTQPAPSEPSEPEDTTAATEPGPPPGLVAVEDPQTGETVYILPEYAELYQLNTDLVGWISIPDTKVNYPVVQTPDSIDYYLHRDFYGKDSAHGCIYVREDCDVFAPSDNLTIYGHRMRDGSMFCSLLNYKDRSYYEDHKYITFNTLTEHHTYEVIAVFITTANRHGFYYHLFVDGEDAEHFDSYIADCKDLALYDTGVSAQYGDKLITLSTCEWSRKDGRLVVVAKCIE